MEENTSGSSGTGSSTQQGGGTQQGGQQGTNASDTDRISSGSSGGKDVKEGQSSSTVKK
jgi:hypothetical protein